VGRLQHDATCVDSCIVTAIFCLLIEFYLIASISKFFNVCYMTLCFVGFYVLSAVSTKMAVLSVVVPCGLVEVYQCFRGACLLPPITDDGRWLHETFVNFFQTTRRYNSEDRHLFALFYCTCRR
jgi:hypothetical protein